MDGHPKLFLWTAVVVGMVAVLIVQMWPYRRFREIVVSRLIAARPEHIWDAYSCDPDNPVSSGFHDTVESSELVSEDPKIVDLTVDASGRNGTHSTVVRTEILAEDRPYHMASRCLGVDDRPFPFGEENYEELRLEEDAGETVATITWRGEIATLGQYWAMRRFMTKTVKSLKSYCETGQGTMIPPTTRSPWRSLALTALAFGSFTFLFGWVAAIILSVAIVIHEFGHWVAMRLTGQPKPRIMLVPFFGGAAVPNHPHKSQFDDAFVSLMGAGISVVPCLALLAAAMLVGHPEFLEIGKLGKSGGPVIVFGPSLYMLASLIGLLNALQLLPVLPLDGGHVVRSLIESTNIRRARPILLGLAGTGIVAFLLLGDYILAAILALGAMQAWHLGTAKPTARPMGRAGMAVIGTAYILIFGIHAGAVVVTMRMLDINLF